MSASVPTPDQLRCRINDMDRPRVDALVKSLVTSMEEEWQGSGCVTVHVEDGGSLSLSERVASLAAQALRTAGWEVRASRYDGQRDGSGWTFVICGSSDPRGGP